MAFHRTLRRVRPDATEQTRAMRRRGMRCVPSQDDVYAGRRHVTWSAARSLLMFAMWACVTFPLTVLRKV